MIRPKKEDFEYYQEGLMFKTVNVLNYSKKQDEYIDYLESKALNIVNVSQQRELLFAFTKYLDTDTGTRLNQDYSLLVDGYLKPNNCG